MPFLECNLTGDFDQLLEYLHKGILSGDSSTSWTGGSDYSGANFRCAVRVYERYHLSGGNRVSLNLTLVGEGKRLFLSAIPSGGSKVLFVGDDTAGTEGENEFLDCVMGLAEQWNG